MGESARRKRARRVPKDANGVHREVYAVRLRSAAGGAAARHARDSHTSAKRPGSVVRINRPCSAST